MTITQRDIARTLGVQEMVISRTARQLGGGNIHPLTDHKSLCLLTVGMLRPIGLTYSSASELISKFESEVRFLAMDPKRRAWIVFVERPDAKFEISCISPSHLEAVLTAHPFSLVLSLHEPVAQAHELLLQVKAKKADAA